MSSNLNIIRKLIEYSFKKVPVKEQFTFTVFEILLFLGRSVLCPAQWVTGAKGLKFQWKIYIYTYSAFVGIAWKVIVLQAYDVLNGF